MDEHKSSNIEIFDNAHRQAMIFGAGFIRIDANGEASNVSIDDVYKQVLFIQQHRVPEAKDPVKTQS